MLKHGKARRAANVSTVHQDAKTKCCIKKKAEITLPPKKHLRTAGKQDHICCLPSRIIFFLIQGRALFSERGFSERSAVSHSKGFAWGL